jgi:acetyl-CoA synthetase
MVNANVTPAWIPTQENILSSNIYQFMTDGGITNLTDFRAWAFEHYREFWPRIISRLDIVFKKPFTNICKLDKSQESPQWLLNAKLNIADSCFTAKHTETALIFYDKHQKLQKMSYGELNHYTNQIAFSLTAQDFKAGDAIAIVMPMSADAVAIYLGIIKMGGVVVSIADSFSSEEIATRLRITQAKGIFTQDTILRGEKKLSLYTKVIAAEAPITIVLPCNEIISETLRLGDLAWNIFLLDHEISESTACDPMSACNILFSSGTTGDPKAIPWNHTTPIKVASDAFFHQNIQPGDVLTWPTNLGWMMGPWLVFAALINNATIAIYPDVARDRAFGEFVQNTKVTMLGVVPTLVATWRQSHCMENLDWKNIKVFSSTGECSNPDDMLYLMSLANNKPIIEYCGGTEIGGCYLTSTVIENNYPALFSGPAIGMHLLLLDEAGNPTQNGEVAILPPSIGLSTSLLNANHHEIYFANMPHSPQGKILRRHGDQACQLDNGYYCILGRLDDTMNLGGIKISSAEIERSLVGIDDIHETAAIAITPALQGPSQLIIYAATTHLPDKNTMMKTMQARINSQLNPLFKIHDVVFITELPKTASNKIMRRVLRNHYQANVE